MRIVESTSLTVILALAWCSPEVNVWAQSPRLAFKTPVRITAPQAELLRTEASQLAGRVAPRLRELPVPGDRSSFNVERIRAASERLFLGEKAAIARTETTFLALSQTEDQRAGASVFFADFINRYSNAYAALWDVSFEGYAKTYEVAVRVLKDNEVAYALVASGESLTFNLAVKSVPPQAAVSYKRVGDAYEKHPDPTSTTIENLIYAVWIIEARLKGAAQEKQHNPFRESHHVVTFDF